MCSGLIVRKLSVHRTLGLLRKTPCYFCRWHVFQAFTGVVISGFLRCAEPELGLDACHAPPCEQNPKTSLNDQWNGLKPRRPRIHVFRKSLLQCVALPTRYGSAAASRQGSCLARLCETDIGSIQICYWNICVVRWQRWHKVLASALKPPCAPWWVLQFYFLLTQSSTFEGLVSVLCSPDLFLSLRRNSQRSLPPLFMFQHKRVKRWISVPVVTREND